MSLYQLKSRFQHQLRPISNQLVAIGISANQVTISAVMLNVGTALIVARIDCNHQRRILLILPLSLFLRMAMNAIDGMMAREHKQATRQGAILNEAGDIVSDWALLASFRGHLSPKQQSQLSIVQKLSLATEIIAIAAEKITGARANHGPLGKSDRAFEIGVIGTLVALNAPLKPITSFLLVSNQLFLIKTSINRLAFIAAHYFDYFHPAPPLAIAQSKPLPFFSPSQGGDMPNSSTKTPPIISEQSCFNAYDGTAIYYRYWLTMPLSELKHSQIAQKQVILMHRGHEHSGRLKDVALGFVNSGYQVFAWDARGNGRSGGIKDHAKSVTELERDLDDFVRLVVKKSAIALENTIIVASSIGATLAAAWVHDYAPNIRGMILATPALRIRLYLPFALPMLKAARKLNLMPRVSSYVKAQVLTHDKAAQAEYQTDPLISSSISSDLLIDTHATGKRLLDDAGAITTPTFILCAGKDYVVDKQAERDFYEGIRAPNKYWKLYPDSFHAIFHETNKAEVIKDCIDFAETLFDAPAKTVDLSQAHNDSASKDTVDRLAIKPFNPSFALTRLAMQKFGHISDAIATGLEHGFDSGSSLDKVYDNQPRGKNVLGRAVDKFYLNNIGWQGIRIRRQHLLELAKVAIDDLNTDKSQLKLLDIASGNGDYVMELLQQFDHISAELRDYDSHNIKVLQEKALEHGVSTRAQALQKDAFCQDSYAHPPAFDLAIASGVFELFSSNGLIMTALEGIYQSLTDGGYFIYTNQPWHPEQEFIGKTLTNHQGQSWLMRCRSQAEIDQLVQKAGFTKVAMRIDHFGIFTVSLAKKDSRTI